MQRLDPMVLAQLREDLPPDILARIVQTFADDAAKLVADLGAAVAAADGAAFRRAAHTLAGAAGTIGAVQLEQVARRCMGSQALAEQDRLCTIARDEAAAAVLAWRTALAEAS